MTTSGMARSYGARDDHHRGERGQQHDTMRMGVVAFMTPPYPEVEPVEPSVFVKHRRTYHELLVVRQAP
jgi:hypothetical protein